MTLLVYTFRTFPFKKALCKQGIEPFIFGALKKDLPAFLEAVMNHGPRLILGLAAATGDKSRLEPVAINVFHGRGKVSRDGPASFDLYVPRPGRACAIECASAPTASFCNWSAYKIAEALAAAGDGNTRLMFAHVTGRDLPAVLSLALRASRR